MRILVIGRGETTGAISAIFPGRPDYRIARFGATADAAEVIDGSEPVLALLHVGDEALGILDTLHLLTAKGAQVVVLADDLSQTLRAAAFDAGASDVLFPPITSRRIESAVLSLLGRPARRETRFQAKTSAIIGAHAPGAPTFRGTVLDLSRGGFKARIPGQIPTSTVVRIALAPPAPHRIPTLFALLLATEPDESPGWNLLRARFVGISSDERTALAGYVETLEPEPVDPLVSLDALRALDVAALAEADLGTVAGMRIPPLTAAERAALAAPENSAERALAPVALARARINMLFELFDRAPDLTAVAENRLDPATLRAEQRAALDATREAASRAVARGNAAELRDLTDLQARVNAAGDLLERTIALFSDDVPTEERPSMLQETSGPARFERPAAAPIAPAAERPAEARPRTRRVPLVVASLLAAALAVAMGASLWGSGAERNRDPALDAVATRPVATVEGIRLRSVFVAKDGTRVAVADGSWFRIPPMTRDGSSRILARKLAETDREMKRLEIRDYRGRRLAVLGSGGTLTLYPAPYVSERGTVVP